MSDYHSDDSAAAGEALAHARDVLMAHTEGVLRFGEQTIGVRYTVENATGRLLASVPVAVLLETEHTLFVPEESDDALAMIVTPERVEESGATDRWTAFHGEPEHVRWALLWVESVKHGAWVFDGEAVMRPNALAGQEPALVKRCNADAGALARVCQRFAGVVVPGPVCVGVDPGGLHVRARFGVVRVRFPEGEGDASSAIEGLFAAV